MRWAKSPAPAQSRGIALILLGWGEWIEKYRETAERLAARDYEVVILEWRGQGLSSRFLSNRSKTWIKSFDVLLDDLTLFYDTHLADVRQPIVILAHSMGAHLGLRWLMNAGRSARIDKVILLSLMQEIKTPPFPLAVAKMIINTACFFGLGKAYAVGQESFDQGAEPFAKNPLTGDEVRYTRMVVQLREYPGMKVGGVTYGWLYALLQSTGKLEKELRRGVPKRHHLILGPEKDPLVESAAMKRIAPMLPFSGSAFFAGARHELLQEKDTLLDAVWAAIDVFLEKE